MKTANENVIRALARVMAAARAGDVEAVAIIACSADGVPDNSFGGEAELFPSVNLGIDMLKAELIARARGAVLDQPVSALVRPAGNGLDS